MALNDDFNFDLLPETVRRAFLRTPERMLLKAGVRIYRWANEQAIAGPNASPWWSFVETASLPSGAKADGFRVTEERARRLGKTHRQLARSRAAISDEFGNTMAHLVVAQLLKDVWAAAGQASGQPEFAKARTDLQNVFLIGGAYQLWIPNLVISRDLQVLPSIA